MTETDPPPDGKAEAGPDAPYALSATWLLGALNVRADTGLSSGEAAARLGRFGPNRIEMSEGPSFWRILLDQLRGAVVWLLAAAAGLSAWLGDWAEAVAIVIVLVLNTAIGFATEFRAVSSMAALKKLTQTTARVRRDGTERRIDAGLLVPGDIVVLEAGDLVPADLRLIEAADLYCDESTLTGESVPVLKSLDPLTRTALLADRVNMAFRGTAVTRGSGLGVVAATGRRTQIGEIAGLVKAAEGEATPLERRLDRLGRNLALGAIAVAALVGLIGVIGGRPVIPMIEMAVALAVAAVPEGLPIVATLALARGMWRMAERNVLINRLSAVETLGSTTVLMTDKTGTLTENRMTVERILFLDRDLELGREGPAGDDPVLDEALIVAALCNDAMLAGDPGCGAEDIGDPMEIALLRAAERLGQAPRALRDAHPRLRTLPFDPDTKLMAVIHGTPEDLRAAVKGAPEAILAAATRVMTAEGPADLTPEATAALGQRVDSAAADGLRLLGIAMKPLSAPDEDPFAGLTLIGLVALIDPPRTEVREAIADCRSAGVRVVMVTGDHAATARKIAADVGLVAGDGATVCTAEEIGTPGMDRAEADRLLACPIFARVPPRAKLELVALHQANDAVVAMTGDGVNDAPALKKADIGVAMGRRGTQVAADASDVILRDDAFGSIVHAIREGRVIYGNIQAFLRYLFSCNLSEILLVGGSLAIGLPLPLTPLQILFLNLVTDVFPALALGFGDGPRGVMRQRPRPRRAPILSRRDWAGIVWKGCLIGLVVLAVFAEALGRADPRHAGTVAFLTIGLAQLWFVFAFHRPSERIWSSEITRNRYVWGAILLSAALIVASVLLPGVADVLGVSALAPRDWLTIVGASMVPLALNAFFRSLAAGLSPARKAGRDGA